MNASSVSAMKISASQPVARLRRLFLWVSVMVTASASLPQANSPLPVAFLTVKFASSSMNRLITDLNSPTAAENP